jgi:hypothetical protein
LKKTLPEVTAGELRSVRLDPADLDEIVNRIQSATGKNVSAATLDEVNQKLFDALPGGTTQEKLTYLQNQKPTMESVLVEKEKYALRNQQRTDIYSGARTLLSDSGNAIGTVLRGLPSSPRQYLGLIFKGISGFGIVGAIGGIVSPAEGHSRFYSAMNGLTFGALDLFQAPKNGAPKTSGTQQVVQGGGQVTQSQTGGPQSFDVGQNPSDKPPVNATVADQSNVPANTGQQSTNPTPTQPKKLIWY